jgi:Astacin (Peptidase family M12A)/Papain-like cysteine protease AvrRpt2
MNMWKSIAAICLTFAFNLTLSGQKSITLPYKFPFMPGKQQVRAQVRNGLAVFQGDIILGRVGPGRGGAEVDFSAFSDGQAWEGGVIPYTIDTSIAEGSTLLRVIRRAIDTINATTVLRLVPYNVNLHPDYVTYQRYVPTDLDASGSSYVGRQGGQQFIDLIGSANFGTVLHETLHAAGVMHEQSRPDRSTYVNIFWDRIDPDALHNFDSLPSISTVSPYDFGSIMHYPAKSFPRVAGAVTIEAKRAYRAQAGRMGQDDKLSAGDIATLARLYPPASTQVRVPQPDAISGASGTSGGSGLMHPDSAMDRRFTVPLIAQPTNMSCWAASIAMIYAWFRNVRVDPVEIREGVGVWRYFPSEWRSSGLLPNEPRVFQRFHFCCERPQAYSVDSLYSLLCTFGPLWVASSVDLGGSRPTAHVRVITGMHGDGNPDNTYVVLNDPWGDNLPPNPTTADMANNIGRTYEVTFTNFLTQLNNLTEQERRQGHVNPIYIVHAPSLDVLECTCN